MSEQKLILRHTLILGSTIILKSTLTLGPLLIHVYYTLNLGHIIIPGNGSFLGTCSFRRALCYVKCMVMKSTFQWKYLKRKVMLTRKSNFALQFRLWVELHKSPVKMWQLKNPKGRSSGFWSFNCCIILRLPRIDGI